MFKISEKLKYYFLNFILNPNKIIFLKIIKNKINVIFLFFFFKNILSLINIISIYYKSIINKFKLF